MNYVNAWSQFHAIVFANTRKDESQLASLHSRFNRLVFKSRGWCLRTHNADVYAIRDAVENHLLTLNDCQCKICNAPIAANEVHRMSIETCSVCEGEIAAIEHDLYCDEAGIDT